MIIEGYVVRSPEDGFEIEFSHSDRTKLEYREKAYRTQIVIDPLINGIAVERRSIVRWAYPNEDVPMTEADRNRIIENVRKAMAAMNQQVLVD